MYYIVRIINLTVGEAGASLCNAYFTHSTVFSYCSSRSVTSTTSLQFLFDPKAFTRPLYCRWTSQKRQQPLHIASQYEAVTDEAATTWMKSCQRFKTEAHNLKTPYRCSSSSSSLPQGLVLVNNTLSLYILCLHRKTGLYITTKCYQIVPRSQLMLQSLIMHQYYSGEILSCSHHWTLFTIHRNKYFD